VRLTYSNTLPAQQTILHSMRDSRSCEPRQGTTLIWDLLGLQLLGTFQATLHSSSPRRKSPGVSSDRSSWWLHHSSQVVGRQSTSVPSALRETHFAVDGYRPNLITQIRHEGMLPRLRLTERNLLNVLSNGDHLEE
jgi:hypothetical protein